MVEALLELVRQVVEFFIDLAARVADAAKALGAELERLRAYLNTGGDFTVFREG